MTTAEYWRDRAEMVMEKGMARADVVLRDLQKMYAQAARDVQAEIDKLYRMYAQESGLSYADAQAYLNRAERTEWRMTLAEYVDRINATGDKALLAELNALAAQSRVRRFRQVLTAIDVAASELRSGGEQLTEKLLRGAYRSAYRMAGDLLAGGTLEALSPASVAQALAYPWSGASFSDRIWSNAEQLAQTLRRTVTQGLIQGQDVRQMAAGVQKATGAAMHRAETLIRTETARCIEDGTLAGYKAAGVERYQILVSPDSRTCDACARLDGAVFCVDEAVTGVNYPPFHPNCRDTTVPYFSDEELARWEQLGAGREGGSDGQGREERPTALDFKSGETIEKTADRDILEKKEREDIAVHTIARIDIEKYRVVSDNIRTDEVIITDERIEHIKERHPNDYERYVEYMKEIIEDPEYILESKKPNTAWLLKRFVEDNEQFELILRLSVPGDQEGYKNSVITFLWIGESRYRRYTRTKKILYKKE